jgi:RNA polymerase sigma factor (sigma-70 family)
VSILRNREVARPLAALCDGHSVSSLSDQQLLERFSDRSEPVAELAFSALVARHGPMVLRVCRAILWQEQDAQDACQAVFVVLTRRANSLWVDDSLGPWLHRVALRVSSQAKTAREHRRRREAVFASQVPREFHERARDDLAAALHEEIGRLPDIYRRVLILCHLEGSTCDDAATRLGWPIGTVKSRLSRGRERLRIRLIRRGIAPAAALSVATAARTVWAKAPARLAIGTMRTLVAAFQSREPSRAFDAIIHDLLHGGQKMMIVNRLRSLAALVLVGAVVSALGSITTDDTKFESPPQPKSARKANVSSTTKPKSDAPATTKTPIVASTKLDQILKRWEQEAAGIKTLDVRLTRYDKHVVANDADEYEGRLIVKCPNLASIDFNGQRGAPYAGVRFSESEVHLLQGATKQEFVFPRTDEQRKTLPWCIRLPFLLSTDSDELKRQFHIELVSENERSVILRFIPNSPRSGWSGIAALFSFGEIATKDALSEALVILNAQTYVPGAYKVISPNGKDFQLYKVKSIMCNRPVAPGVFEPPVREGWSVIPNPRVLAASPFRPQNWSFVWPSGVLQRLNSDRAFEQLKGNYFAHDRSERASDR